LTAYSFRCDTISVYIPEKYGYLAFTLAWLVPWLFFYWRRKDLRKEMIAMSFLIAVLGLFSEYLWWTKDWWHPQTITGTTIGLEDALLGFGSGGIAAVFYEEVFKKRIYKYRSKGHTKGMVLLVVTFFLAMSGLFYFFHLTSFATTTISFILVSAIVIFLRKDLFLDAIFTGFCAALGAIPIYLLLQYLSPGFIEHTWTWSSLSGIRFLGIPIEDIIFYFLGGIFISPLYLYWKSEKLRKPAEVKHSKKEKRG